MGTLQSPEEGEMNKALEPQASTRIHWAICGAVLVSLVIPACGGGGGGGGGRPASADGFTVSGTVTAAAGTFADGDVNDPNAPYAANDTIPSAQPIGNPSTVGGYVNQPGSGPSGRSRNVGDIDDAYRVSLAAGQAVTLTIADAVAGDLDLYLGDTAGNLVASSEGTGVTETIIVPAAGTYVVDVYAFDGASNYILTIGQSLGSTAPPALSVLSDFVPGELLARFEEAPAGDPGLGERLSALGLRAAASDAAAVEGPVLIRLDAAAASRTGRVGAAGTVPESLPLWVAGNPELEHKWRTLRAIKLLGRQRGVRYAEPNYVLKASAVPSDPGYGSQWHYPLMNLPQAWDISTGSNAVIVAVIDTGILPSHPDLQGQLVAGYDFISDPANALDGNGRDSDPSDPGDQCCVGSSSFHGTHVAGTVAAATNNATGVAGVAWGARIMPLRVLGLRGGSTDDVNQAILFAARLPNASGSLPAQRADIVNMSLGGPSFSQAQQDVVAQARGQGVIVVAAAGNEAQSGNPIGYPAAYTGVVSVAAVAIDRTRAPYSSTNAFVDVAAPGGDNSRDLNGDGYADGVLSTWADDSSGAPRAVYGFSQGTSMAAPHVAGVAALMKAVNPALTPAQFESLLVGGALTQDLGPAGRDDQFGHGLLDAYRAVVAAQTSPTPVPANLVATPTGLNFGPEGTSAALSLANGGGGALNVTSVSDDASWLTIGAAVDPGTGLGARTVSVNRAGLGVGTYTATISVASSANAVQVPVIMQVSASGAGGDAGFHYVLLLDPETGETMYDVGLTASNGRYAFSIADVAEGSYVVVAGSDYNNDFYVCDAGEACGAYPTLDSYAELVVGGNVTGVDFLSGLNTVVEPQGAGASGPAAHARARSRRAAP